MAGQWYLESTMYNSLVFDQGIYDGQDSLRVVGTTIIDDSRQMDKDGTYCWPKSSSLVDQHEIPLGNNIVQSGIGESGFYETRILRREQSANLLRVF